MDGSMLAPAIVFLVLYILLFFSGLYFIYLRVRDPKQRIFGILLIMHVVIRIASEITSIGGAVVGLKNYRWFVANIVLTQQGYMWIVFSFLIFVRNYIFILRNDHSVNDTGSVIKKKFRVAGLQMSTFGTLVLMHKPWRLVLIGANVLTIVGGAAFIGPNGYTNYKASLGLRMTGCSIFLLCIQAVLVIVVWQYRKALRKLNGTKLPKFKETFFRNIVRCYVVLTVRGIYSIVGIVVDKIQFFNFDHLGNATSGGLAAEYCMGTLMEFTAACLLLVGSYRYDISRHEPDTATSIEEIKISDQQEYHATPA